MTQAVQSVFDDGKRLTSFFDTNQLLTYSQASEFLKVSVRTLKRLKAAGKIPYVEIGTDSIRFRVSSLIRWTEEREIS